MKIAKILLPLLIVASAVGIATYLFSTSPEPKRHSKPKALPSVEIMELTLQDHDTVLKSQGIVAPRTQTTLVAEVTGKVLSISSKFRAGSFFNKGDLLLTIDPRNYENAVTIAEAELALKQVALDQEKAQAKQAKRDWDRLGTGGAPSALVLRKPQLASSKAAIAAARARLKQAKTDLERAAIRAPYSGRVLEHKADAGQFVTLGTPLGTIYAIDYVEIKLPLSEADLSKLELPESYQNEEIPADAFPAVTLTPPMLDGATRYSWTGRIVRVAGALDPKTRQPFVVAQVDTPYQKKDDTTPPLKIGQFVEARIAGKTLSSAYRIPSASLSSDNELLLIDSENLLHPTPATVIAKDGRFLFIHADIPADHRLVTTRPPLATEGMKVTVRGEEPAKNNTPKEGAQ